MADRSPAPEQRATASRRKLWVGGINAAEDEFKILCERYGPLERLEMKHNYAFVTFLNASAAETMLQEQDQARFLGEVITVQWAKSYEPHAKGDGCFNCGGTGHWSRDCPQKRDDRPREGRRHPVDRYESATARQRYVARDKPREDRYDSRPAPPADRYAAPPVGRNIYERGGYDRASGYERDAYDRHSREAAPDRTRFAGRYEPDSYYDAPAYTSTYDRYAPRAPAYERDRLPDRYERDPYVRDYPTAVPPPAARFADRGYDAHAPPYDSKSRTAYEARPVGYEAPVGYDSRRSPYSSRGGAHYDRSVL